MSTFSMCSYYFVHPLVCYQKANGISAYNVIIIGKRKGVHLRLTVFLLVFEHH